MTNQSKVSYTPGPWKVQNNGSRYIEIVGDRYIAKVYNHSTKSPTSYPKENEVLEKEAQANAKAIATVPQLVEALKAMVNAYYIGQKYTPTSAIGKGLAALKVIEIEE